MQMIFEPNIERSDFLELILTPEQVEQLLKHGVVKDFPKGLFGIRNLNIFIRVEMTEEEEDAISERSSSEDEEGFFREYTPRDLSGKTTKTSRSYSL